MNGAHREERSTTIRFSQVDAAGIVFYARYFEIISRLFPETHFRATPFTMRARFLRPNRLGDRIAVIGEADEDSGRRKFSGRFNGAEHFTIEVEKAEQAPSGVTLRRDESLRVAAGPLGAWAAGIDERLQFSRYFEYINRAVEEWLGASLGVPIEALVGKQTTGIPTVSFKTDCRDLPSFEDDVEMWIYPQRVGGKSLTLRHFLIRGDEVLIDTEQVIVFVTMTDSGFESTRVPQAIRDRIDERRSMAKADRS